MENVWATLKRRKRKPSRPYEHQAGWHGESPLSNELSDQLASLKEVLQNQGLGSLFIAAAGYYRGARPAISAREIEAAREPYLLPAQRLQELLTDLRAHGIGREPELKALEGLTLECNLRADVVTRLGWPVVDRATGDMRLRGYLIELAGTVTETFGSPLYGVVANIASVALDKSVTPKMVRDAVTRPCP
jgi:hypothetical protein